MNKDLSNRNFSLNKILDIIIKDRRLVIFVTLIIFLISAFITFGVMKPKYTSTTQLLVNQKVSKNQLAFQAQQVQSDVQRVYTYKDIITSPVVQRTVANDLKNQGDVKNAKIDVTSQQNSQVFSVSTTTDNPYLSANVANDTAKVFQKRVKKIMDVNSVTVVSKAYPKLKPTSPHYVLNLVIGLVLGILIGSMLAIIRELNDKKVYDVDYLENDLGLNNLGVLFEIDKNKMKNSFKNSHRPNDHRRRV